MPKPPLRIPTLDLDANSLLYFVHVPKTAGTSVRRFLDRYFLPQQVFPPEITVPPRCQDSGLLESYPDSSLDHFRLVVGHHDCHGLAPWLERQGRRVQHVTLLREPVSQLVSEYKMLRTDPQYPYHDQFKDLSFDAFLEHPAFPWIRLGNRQIGHLLAQLPDVNAESAGDGGLATVLRWLETFAAVGIHEELARSLQLFAFVFGWTCPTEVPHCNRARFEDFELTGDQRRQADNLTAIDQRLYLWARARFLALYDAMLEQLQLAADAGTTPTETFDERLRTALNASAATRRRARLAADAEVTGYEVIEAEGFLTGHLNRNWGRYIQWIGPKPEATVRLAFYRAVDTLLYIRVDFALKKKMLDHLTVRLNGQPIPLQWTPAGNAHHFIGFIPAHVIGLNRESALLTLKTSSVTSPAQIAPSIPDTEIKCLAISSIELCPAVAAEPLDRPARRLDVPASAEGFSVHPFPGVRRAA